MLDLAGHVGGQLGNIRIQMIGGVLEGDGDDLLIQVAAVLHGDDADGEAAHQTHGANGLAAQHQHVQRVAVIGPGTGNEAVVGGVVGRGVEDTVQPQHTGILVHLVFVLGALFDLDDRPEILGLYPRRRDIMPNVHRMFLLFQFVPWTHYSAEKRGAQRDFATLSKCFFERC